MLFDNKAKPKVCEECGYKAYPPYPAQCPKCNKVLIKNNDLRKVEQKEQENLNQNNSFAYALKTHQNKNGEQKSNFIRDNRTKIKKFIPKKEKESDAHVFTRNLLFQSHPDMVISGKSQDDKKIQDSPPLESENRTYAKTSIKVKKKIQQSQVSLDSSCIDLETQGEYFRYFGIIAKNREIIFSSNENFKYLLDLGINLEYISTSILSGDLDRMLLKAQYSKQEEYCYFYTDEKLIYVLYGNIPSKKASWIINQLKISFKELFKLEPLSKISKIDLYNFQTTFQKRLKYFLKEYIKLQSVFTSNELKSVDKYLRVDYFGLSFQSIGILSKLITDNLEFTNLPVFPLDLENREEMIEEMKEGQITAKLEAMAANCVANTEMVPQWISVKLGFQRYRFIIFSKINNYYISLLTEGNLDYRDNLINELKKKLNTLTSKPFIGELKQYYDHLPDVVSYIKNENISKQ